MKMLNYETFILYRDMIQVLRSYIIRSLFSMLPHYYTTTIPVTLLCYKIMSHCIVVLIYHLLWKSREADRNLTCSLRTEGWDWPGETGLEGSVHALVVLRLATPRNSLVHRMFRDVVSCMWECNPASLGLSSCFCADFSAAAPR